MDRNGWCTGFDTAIFIAVARSTRHRKKRFRQAASLTVAPNTAFAITLIHDFAVTGTLTVNLLGSAVIGILAGLFESTAVSQQLKLFLMVGILGGFTTFSAFSLENMQLLKSGQARLAVIYILTSNVIGITLALGGFFSARWALRFF